MTKLSGSAHVFCWLNHHPTLFTLHSDIVKTRQQCEGQLNPLPQKSDVSLSGGIFGSEVKPLALTTLQGSIQEYMEQTKKLKAKPQGL